MLEIIQLLVLNDNYIHVLHDTISGETAVVDPAVAEPVLQLLKQKNWQLTYLLNTHHHSDHVGGNLELKQKTNCIIIGSEIDKHRIPAINKTVNEGDIITLGNHQATIMAMTGHTIGHIAYYFKENEALFCGDTLFAMGCGRLFEGTAEQLWQSLQKLKTLPLNTRCYCAHEYTQNNGRFALSIESDNEDLKIRITEVNQLRLQGLSTIPTTIAQELKTNPFLREHSLSLQQHLGLEGASAVEIFTQLRRLKDHF
ncbi:MAG: hydroxyacylglutathione hydrolase [Methylococcaceae bacterium]